MIAFPTDKGGAAIRPHDDALDRELSESCPTGCSKSAKTYRLTICCTECSEYYLQIRGGLAIMAYKRTSLII